MQIHEISKSVESWRTAKKCGQTNAYQSSDHRIYCNVTKSTLQPNISNAQQAMNDVSLNRKRITRYLGEPTVAHRDRAYATEEGSVNLPSAYSNMKKC